ncbi:hypothetical protein EOM81_11660 [bacterium]|nr:hypothetical protein [bacterium]
MDRGFITLYRKIADWEWYTEANTFRVFIHLLLTANWEDKCWRGNPVKRGQKITSVAHIADELRISDQSVRTSLNRLKSTNEITIKTTNKYTVVTLTNYESYQPKKKESTNKTTSESTNGQQTTNKQLTTTKQLIQLKQLNNNNITPAEPNISDEKPDEKFITEADLSNKVLTGGKIGRLENIPEWTKAFGALQFSQAELSAVSKLIENGCIPEDVKTARLNAKGAFGKADNEFTARLIMTEKDKRIESKKAPKPFDEAEYFHELARQGKSYTTADMLKNDQSTPIIKKN